MEHYTALVRDEDMHQCGTIVSSEGPVPSRDILVALPENLDDE